MWLGAPRSYITRPAICIDRLRLREDGQVQYQLKRSFSNGTTNGHSGGQFTQLSKA
jgi:hypothetical protein